MTAPSLDSSPPEPDTAPTPPADPAAVWSPAVRLLLQNAAEEAARLLGAHGAFLYLLDAETQRLRFTHDAGTAEVGRQAWVRELELPVGVGMFGKSVEQRRVLVSDDYPNDTTFPHAEGPDRLVREVGIRSLVVAPLLAGQDAYGALGTFSREPAAFTAPQIALVRALADHAAGALANARLIEELGRSREELARRADIERSLREIGARISAAHDTADVVQRAVDEALRLLAGDGARIDLVDPVLGLLRKAYMSGAEQPTEEEWPDDPDERLDEGISGRAVVESRTVWTGDYMADQAIRHGRGPDTYVASRGIRSAMAAPLVGADGAFGAVTVWSGRTDAFGATDASVLETIAGQASVAIGRARLIEELQRSREEVARRAEEERALREIGARLSNIADPASVLERIVEESARLLGAERVRLDLVEPLSGQDLWTHPASWIERDRSPLSGPGGPAGARGITGLSIRESRTIVSPDYLEDERFEHYDDADTEVAAVGMCSITATPVFGESGLQGVLQLGSRDRNAFGDDQVRLVERLAAQAAVAITNARLVDRLETSQAALGKKAGAERALREIAGRMMSIQDPGDLLQQVVDEAARLLGSRGAVIDLMDTATGDIRRGYDAGIDEALRETWESTRARTAGIRKAIRERRVVVTDDAAGDTDSGSDPAGHVLLERGVKAVACAPLIGEAGALGTLSVFAADPDAFDHDAAELLGALAGQATIAIRNAELIRELGRSREELSRRAETERTLREIAARITSIRDNEGILALIVDEARRVLGSDGAHLTRMVDARRVLRPVVVAGGTDPETREWLQNMEFPLNAGINGLAAGLGRVVWTPHYALDPRIPRERDDLDVAERLGLGAMAAAPLRAPGGEVIGTLAISYRTPGPIRAERLEVLQALADHAAIALSNSDLLERLEESEARYRRLVQATPDVIWQVDAEGRLSFIADSAAQLFGWPAAELTGRHFSELVADESRGLAAEGWTTLTSQHDRSWRLRLVLRRQDGTTFPSEVSAVSFSDDGQFAGGQGTIRDISERERLERDLRESEERYRDLVQLSPDLIFAMDGEGVYTFFSARTTETIGWRPEELVGRPFRDFLDLESFPNAAEEWTKFSAEPGRPTVNRMHLRHKDGRLIPFEVSAVGQVEDGELVAVRGVARDIGERERLEAELRASEERYRFLVENSPDVVFATDPEGRFTFMSETIERAIGRSPTEIVGNHFSTIVAQDALPYAAARWEALVADPFTLQTVRLKLVRADGGDPVPVEVSAIGIVDGDGRFAGIHGSTRDISERERLLAELRESEERHRVLVQSSPDLIFAIDPEGRYTFMSDRVEEMLGWRTDEVLGQHFGAFVDPAWFSEVEGQIDQLHARPGAPQTHQMVIRHKDGREIPYEVSAVAVVEPDGSLRAIHGVARDVGERVRLERELRESEERYRFLVENSPDIVYSTDGEGTFTYVSESIEKALGRKPGDLVGRHVSTIINYATPADIGRRWGVLREHPEHGITDRFELVHADGTIKPYEVSAVAITRDGVFTGVHGAARDIGERERLGAELRASEERYRYLVQSSPDLVWVTDEEGRFTFVSDTAASILGWEPAELIGKSFTELAPPDDGGRAVARFRWLAAKPTRVHRSQITIRTKDGRDILMDISGIGMVDDGRFVGAHGAARDVSDRERLERDLRRQAAELASSEERSHLARELHDSVTQALFSMTLLSRSIELLLQRDPAQVPEKLASLRDLQRDALAEMRALIFELRPGNVEEQGLITALRTHAAALAGRIGLPVIVEADLPERPPIDVEEALYRIAQEALHNIVKHAGARQVRVEVGRVAEGVRLRVTDDGRGFDPTKVPDGHLGLAGMRARAEKLGGHLDVRSTVGSGTAVEVVVPIGSPRPVGVTNGSH